MLQNLIIIKSINLSIIQKEKKILLWIYARRLSSHLCFNGRRKSLVAGLN